MKIRSANSGDIPSIMKLERSCAGAAHWTEEHYRKLFLPEGGSSRLVLVAEESQELLGFLVAQQVVPDWELENVVVAPSRHRTGIGSRLVGALADAARRANSSAVFLEVRESNHAARRLYEKAGFEQMGDRRGYYANPAENAVLYRLKL